ncbi:MAG TPA: ATP-binding protein [Anaeromyxobacter sp.]|nr:ATP-binding protein [Anaeromyxobacter sp.]
MTSGPARCPTPAPPDAPPAEDGSRDALRDPEALDELVLAERVRLLHERARPVLAMLAASAAILVAVVGQRPLGPGTLAWIGAMAGSILLRAGEARAYAARARLPAEARRWARLYCCGSALSGVLWGAAGLLFYVPGAPIQQAVLVLVIGGLAGGAAGTNFTYFPAVAVFSVPVAAPLLTRLCAEGDRLHLALALLVLVFMFAMTTIGRMAARAIQGSVRMRFRHEALAAHHAREVVQHREAARALRESEALFRDLAERAIVGVYLIQDGVLRYVNPRMAEIFGYAPEELMGKVRNIDLTHPDDHALVEEGFRERLAAGLPSLQYEFRGLRKDGRVIEVEAFGSRTSLGGRPAIVGTLIDNTRRKLAEQEQAKVQKLESLGILAGGIAHDFNNLLAAILGDISLARESSADRQLRELLSEAEGAALRARDLTQQLLTFSRGGEPVRKRVAVAPLLRATASLALRGSRVACEYDLPEELWPVHVDEGQIGQVIQNLVLNAVQAMDGAGTLRISARNVADDAPRAPGEEPRPRVRIEVADTGPGIAPDVAQRIFDPYFTTKATGTGLGLTTVHSIVTRHGGQIRLDSAPGRGATFVVALPAVRDAAEPSAAGGAIVRGRGRVVVMDDDDLVRSALGRMLRRLGYEALPARDGAELLAVCADARAEGRPVDAAIMDLTIPGGMGGKEAIGPLREREPGVRAIVSSGYSKDPVMAEYRAHGFAGVVAKPFRIEELSETLARVLTGPPAGEDGAPERRVEAG